MRIRTLEQLCQKVARLIHGLKMRMSSDLHHGRMILCQMEVAKHSTFVMKRVGHYWSPMASPSVGQSPYVTRHGFGYSIFEHSEDGIRTEVSMYTDIEAPIKFVVITVRNQSDRARKAFRNRLCGMGTGRIAFKVSDARSDRIGSNQWSIDCQKHFQHRVSKLCGIL